MKEPIEKVAAQEEAKESNLNTSTSTLESLFTLGFTVIGDSRDFSNGSTQLVLARGVERITWVFPMKLGKVGVATADGHTYIPVPLDHISFDVVVPFKK